jgi:hypothetical protein
METREVGERWTLAEMKKSEARTRSCRESDCRMVKTLNIGMKMDSKLDRLVHISTSRCAASELKISNSPTCLVYQSMLVLF